MKSKPLRRPQKAVAGVLQAFTEFARLEASGGIVLFAAIAIAMVWANSPWSETYTRLWETELSFGFGNAILSETLHHWINDGLMAIFFFVVGLEIKREIMAGELNSPRQAALPVIAALGGMLAPALIYAAFNLNGEGARGWGIPMATDIAISLGVLALLGKRIPVTLKIYLTALAIVDDIGAVLVIALFYTGSVNWTALGIAAAILVALILINLLGIRHPLVYSVLGIGLWLAFLKSGIHATIGGVLLALTIPAQTRLDPLSFTEKSHQILNDFSSAPGIKTELLSGEQLWALQRLERATWNVETTLQRMEHNLHPWITYFIIPLFALANAGVHLQGDFFRSLTHPVSLGIIVGLLVGKQVGVTAATWLAVRLGAGRLPEKITWRQIYGISWLAGIGFTMSLFINGLAFSDDVLLNIAKMGILVASLVAGSVGWLILRSAPRRSFKPNLD